jgi:hypothetical protein
LPTCATVDRHYYYNQFRHTTLALRIDRNYERQVIEKADQLITVSEM